MNRCCACAIALLTSVSSPSCRKHASDHAADASVTAVLEDAAPDAEAIAPPRCAVDQDVASYGRDVEFGDAVVFENRLAFGVLRGAALERTGALELVEPSKSIGFGAALPDAPPPRPFVLDKRLYVASFPREHAPGERELVLFSIHGEAQERAGSVVQKNGDSFSFDLAKNSVGFFALWEEDVAKEPRGQIKLAILSSDPKTKNPARVLSSDTEDVDAPRIFARSSGGFWAVWIARTAESLDAAMARAKTPVRETPGRTRVPEWIEAVALSEQGAATGPVVRATKSTGHISSFEARLCSGGSPCQPDDLEVFARDDESAGEGVGGKLVRIVVRDGKAGSPETILADGVGRGGPDFLRDHATAWLTYTDPNDRVRLLPMSGAPPSGGTGGTGGRVSIEPALENGRLLAFQEGKFWATFPDDGGRVRRLKCSGAP